MSLFKIGEKDREGRQKRIEHTGEYLRASRTGGVSLRAHTRVSGVNVTGNTSHGVRVSTRLAKNTQVAFQNGRFILRGRYGSDAAKVNLSKSGVSVSTKTPVGAFNWIKPGRSSFKMAGVQVRGHKAAYLQVIYLLIAAVVAVVGLIVQVLGFVVGLLVRGVQALVARREQARREQERLDLTVADVADEGKRILEANDVALEKEPHRDLFAALVFTVTCLGRGRTWFDPAAVGMEAPDHAADHVLLHDVRTAGEQIRQWLDASSDAQRPEPTLGVLHHLAAAFGRKVDPSTRAEALLSLDDACLAAGPRTVLQEAMIDLLAETLDVDLVLEGEG
ncbi:hypothetical protein QWY84_19470 [Aquisalimonas lutea]|uniref:hypothetical protein n=1 Tax=Aquisalimonas lutea TaxID=1327750 RepID=UPI0025B36913|nr:hypothetical protein [Aquisalimonas lutea]MDN3519791.1 hypothetical protein [Aquisalimonas lutea]